MRVRLRVRARRGVRGHRRPLQRRPGAARLRRRLRDHRRADRPARRHPGQGRAGGPDPRPRARRPRLDAVARRQRGREGDRRLPANRVNAVHARVLRAVRPAVDQPRADRRRRRAEQGARRLRDGRRHPLPAQPGPGRASSSRSARSPTWRSRGPSSSRPRTCRARTRTCARCARSSGPAQRRRVDERRPRRRLRRGVVPARRHPRRRVRPGRRRSPRPRGVGLDPLAGALPRAARRLRRVPSRARLGQGSAPLRAVEGGAA